MNRAKSGAENCSETVRTVSEQFSVVILPTPMNILYWGVYKCAEGTISDTAMAQVFKGGPGGSSPGEF